MQASEIAQALKGERIKDGWLCHCPVHEDKEASMKVTERNGKPLFKCYANCDQTAIVEKLKNQGLWDGPTIKGKKNNRKYITTYSYLYEDGTLCFEKLRYEPKSFAKRRIVDDVWVYDTEGLTIPLYNAPLLKRAREENAMVFLVEGEKDADNLTALGLVATTSEARTWNDRYTSTLAGTTVVIIPDRDSVGENHAQVVACQLQITGIEVYILRLPNLPPKGDVTDWIQKGGTRDELLELAFKCEEWRPDQPFAIQGTELAAAQYFLKLHGKNIISTLEQGPFVWDGKRWYASEHRAKQLVQNAMMRMHAFDYDLAEKMQSDHGQRAILSLAAPHVLGNVNDFDAHPDLLNCNNGVLDLRTGELRSPHAPEFRCSKLLYVDYDLRAKCPLWEQFLRQIMRNDEEMVDYLQRALGYSLSGHVSERALFFCYGGGANGKSVTLETIYTLMGEYACNINKKTLMQDRNSGGIPNDVARLVQKRFVTVSETSAGEWFDEGTVKDLTGGTDTVNARFMRREFFDFRPQFKLWMRGNHKPDIRNMDHGIWSRIHLIPFEVQIPDEEQDKHLPAKLRGELPGILAWAVRGYHAWQEIGLKPPEKVTAAVRAYRNEMDLIGIFLAEWCDVGAHGAWVGASDLYQFYRNWCEESGYFPVSQHKFGRLMRSRDGITPDSKDGLVIYSGVTVKQQNKRGRYV